VKLISTGSKYRKGLGISQATDSVECLAWRWWTCCVQCLLTLVAVYILVALVIVLRRLRWRQLASVWNCVDAVVVGLTWLSVLLFIVVVVHDDGLIQSSHCASYAQSAACHTAWRCVNALLLLLLLIIVRNLMTCSD